MINSFQKTRPKIILLVLGLFVSAYGAAQSPTTLQEKKTDAVARKAIKFLNNHQADSVYAMAGEAFRQQVTLAQWRSVNETQLINLLPFDNMTYKGSEDLVNKYKLEGKVTLTFNISLDEKDKLMDFAFTPYREEIKPAAMNNDEMRTDTVAIKVLNYLNTKQIDSAYALAGNDFKSAIDVPTWHNFTEKQLYPLLPLADPVFVGSKNGVSKYKLGQLQLIISLDKTGKYNALAITAYRNDVKKATKAATDNPLHTPLDKLVNKWLSDYIQTKGNVGLSAAVFYKGKDHYYNYGETASGDHKLPNARTIYEIGSITKTFTATLLAKAVTDGLVTLDTHITKFLPDSVAANAYLKPITLKQLANHTSGLPRMPSNFDATVTNLTQPYEHYGETQMFSFLKNYQATRGAGITYEYSNLAVSLLGVILERIYHQPYAMLVKKYITQPLLLNDTKITLTATDLKRLAQGYDAANVKADIWKHASTKAAGAIKSTAFDMLQYGKKQLPEFANPLSKSLALTHRSTFEDGINKVGLGWHYITGDKDNVLQHGGATGGYRTMICVNTTKNMVVVILTNNSTTGDTLGIELMKALGKEVN